MFKKPSSGKKTNLSQFGLLDVDLDDGDDEPMDLSDDDMDLESELAALSGGGPKRHRPRKPAPVPPANLDALIAASLKDVPSDEEESVDEDDPDLLSELKELAIDDDEAPPPPPRTARPAPPPPGAPASGESSTISLLQDRISNYTIAEKAAKESGETSKARRFGRGIKTLNDLLKQAKAGKPIKDEDIPPPASIGKPASAPPPDPTPVETEREPVVQPMPSAPEPEEEPPSLPEPAEPPPPPPPTEDLAPEKQQGLDFIMRRKEEFKAAALAAKRAGDKPLALELLKVVKQFDIVADAYKAGQEMDLNELPTPQMIEASVRNQKEENQTQHSEEPAPAPPTDSAGLITASTVDEALRQRLAAFQQQEAKAKEEGNSAKARRLGRVIKQYQEAIRANVAGKPIAADELPTPAGYAPLPTGGSPPAASPAPARGPAPAPRPAGPAPGPAPAPPPAGRGPAPAPPPAGPAPGPAPAPPPAGRGPAPAPPPAGPAPGPAPAPAPAPRTPAARHDKQLAMLLHRQKQFREAAIKAKKAGDIEQAKEYLRAVKGFDPVIEAARGGLVVDLKSLPLPPRSHKQLENTFDIVSAEDCGPSDDGPTTITADDEDVLTRLHNQLASQLKLCLANRDHNKAMGHIAEANRFEHIAVSVKQDLDVVAVAKSLGQSPPKFHYESRQFALVQCNTDLNENDLELTIVRGIAYNVPNPKEIDTYVKFEFPFPQEAPVSDRTPLVKDTNSPEYNAVFPLAIQRGARACLRVFKRHAIKLEVYSRGGWFSRDALLGAAAVKLAPLETQVTLHEAFPLMDGRRPAGGSIEVKLRVRTPLVQQQVEQTTHRWLVIDN